MDRFTSGSTASERRITAFSLALAAVLLLATAASRSVATDEAFTWGIVAQDDLSGFWSGIEFVGGNMAAYFVVVRGFALFDDSTLWLRLPSVLFALGTIVLIGRVAAQWFGADLARRVTLLASTSVPLLYYGAEMRSYSFVALTSTWLWMSVGQGIRTDERRHWVSAGVATMLMVSGHLISVFMLPWVGLGVLAVSGWSFRGCAIRLLPVALGVLPSAALVAVGDGAKTQWIPELDAVSLARAGRFLLGDHGQFTDLVTGPLLALLYLVVFSLSAVLAVRHRADADRWDVLAWMWFLGLPTTLVLVSIVEPILWHRYLIAALPGALLVAARGLGHIDRRVATTLLVSICLLGIGRTLLLRPHSADEYRELATVIEENAEPGDRLVASPPWSRAGLDYYWRDGAPVRAEPEFGPGFDRGLDFEGLSDLDDTAGIWLIDRSDSGQSFVDTERSDDEYALGDLMTVLGNDYVVDTMIEVQRFRAWRLVPSS